MAENLPANRLIHEKSPYLLQHAHNPVDWYPWGDEAFALAKAQDKPIFLSIGYATCHWCHVMEKESFDNPDIAKILNDAFVNIKVDREELPEIDSIYMEFAQALMSSSGGWPLNVILTSDLKPFFAVTYLPPVTRRGMVGVREFVAQIKELWQSEERSQLVAQADKIVELLEKAQHVVGEELPSEQHIHNSLEVIFELADPVFGGIRGEPKFPLGYQADFLLSYAKVKNDSRSLFYVELTLTMMGRGGIYDHLGGGFSRYATDERWNIPHFEKMLYDNAILSECYLQAWKYTKKDAYKEIVQETLGYILREMTHENGGFYSAQDADTDGKEGLYYTWTQNEIAEVLSKEEAELFCMYYGVSKEGNFEGRSVLHVEMPLDEFAENFKISKEIIKEKLSSAKKALLQRREARKKPFIDDKILSSWNGLMIDAMCKAYLTLKNESHRDAALKTAQFIKANLWKDGKLYRRFREGEARFASGLDDYAYLIKGTLTLFESGFGSEWLEWSIQMAKILELEFKAINGSFYQTSKNESVLIRKCEYYDGAEPSGNAVHTENLLRLYQITGEEKYMTQAEDVLKAAKGFIETFPPGASFHLLALQRYLDPKAANVVIVLDDKETLKQEIRDALAEHFSPHTTVVWKMKSDARLDALLPSVADKGPIDGQTAVYICRQGVCEAPVIHKEEILQAVAKL